ncbi:MAG TPA: low specificity L-threonine aldolase [Thermoanaerobaculia bacterium]|nr:low specificity L-threonine aldolase [Thermoanaerobaculia bacterium]
MTDFRSDNTHGASPEVLEALTRAAGGSVTSYGGDPITARVRERCRELFETDLEIFPVLTGTAGNALAIAAMTPPWGAVFCHDDAHIHRDEMGAPEFFTSGAKLIPIAGADGKLHVDELARAIEQIGGEGRTAKPACVSLTQATEAGTVYAADELRALCEVAHRSGCRVHVDGARFANAVVSSGASPADLTWRAGVDVLVFGGTKNGALAAELIVVFDEALRDELAIRWHRGGHRLSKMRFLSAQFDGYLDVWLRNAAHANAMARRLAARLPVLHPVEANVVFTRFEPHVAAKLRDAGILFYDWPLFGEGAVRLVTGWSTTEEDVDAFTRALR